MKSTFKGFWENRKKRKGLVQRFCCPISDIVSNTNSFHRIWYSIFRRKYMQHSTLFVMNYKTGKRESVFWTRVITFMAVDFLSIVTQGRGWAHSIRSDISFRNQGSFPFESARRKQTGAP